MTLSDGFDRPITAWLEEDAAMRAPDDLLPQVMSRAARTRHRPGWATTGRWISMETRAQLGAVPRSLIVFATLALLTALAAGAITYGAGGPGPSALPPTGVAGNGLLAFESSGDIWVVDPAGGEPRQVTSGPASDHTPMWSRDGTRIAYWSVDERGAPASLIVARADGSDPAAVFTDEEGRTSHPHDWSPDGTQLAFTLCPDVRCGEFYVVATDGSGATMIGGPEVEAYTLHWSPDGATLAFGGRHDPDSDGVYVMAPDGSDIRPVSQGRGLNGFDNVAWSNDGTRILSHAGTNVDGPNILIFPAEGGTALDLTDGPATGYLPGWSPDDAWVAFNQDGVTYVVPSDGGEIRSLGFGSSFVWAPDASSLAIDGAGDLRIVDILTGDTVTSIPDVMGVTSWQRIAR